MVLALLYLLISTQETKVNQIAAFELVIDLSSSVCLDQNASSVGCIRSVTSLQFFNSNSNSSSSSISPTMASFTKPCRVLSLSLAVLLISQVLVMPALARPLVAEKKLTEVQLIHILHVTI